MGFSTYRFPSWGGSAGRKVRFGQEPARLFTRQALEFAVNGIGIDIADDDEGQIVRDVLLLIIMEDVFTAQLVEKFQVADDRILVGMGREGVGKEEFLDRAARVVEAHGKLPADDLHFLDVFVLRQGGMEHGIGKDVEGPGPIFGGEIDIVNRAVKGGVGVGVAAEGLYLLGHAGGGAALGPLEKHVLENVGQSGPQVISLGDAPGTTPGLDGGHRGTVVLLDDQGQPIVQGKEPGWTR
jgi:hypothetical protein